MSVSEYQRQLERRCLALEDRAKAAEARLADLEGLMEIIAPIAYAHWKKGRTSPITGDSASLGQGTLQP